MGDVARGAHAERNVYLAVIIWPVYAGRIGVMRAGSAGARRTTRAVGLNNDKMRLVSFFEVADRAAYLP